MLSKKLIDEINVIQKKIMLCSNPVLISDNNISFYCETCDGSCKGDCLGSCQYGCTDNDE